MNKPAQERFLKTMIADTPKDLRSILMGNGFDGSLKFKKGFNGIAYISIPTKLHIKITWFDEYHPLKDIETTYRRDQHIDIGEIFKEDFKRLFDGGYLSYDRVSVYKRLETSWMDYTEGRTMEIRMTERKYIQTKENFGEWIKR